MAKSAADVAKKWARNLGASTESIRAGVQSVTVSPTEKAAQAADRYVAGVQQAVESGRFQKGLRRVSLQDWIKATLDKGIARISQGANAAVPKMEAFMNEWMPYMEQLQAKLQQMPKGNLEENINRMVTAARFNAQFKRKS